MKSRFTEASRTSPRRVLLVYKHYAPDTGGIESSLSQQVKWYQEAGYDVSVLCCRKRGLKTQRETRNGALVLRCGSLGIVKSVPLSPFFFWYFWRMAVTVNIVHVHLQFPFASFAYWLFARRLKKRWYVTYHMDVYRQKWLKKLTYPFDRYLIRRADCVMTSSPPLKQYSEVLSTVQREFEILPYAISDSFLEEKGDAESQYNEISEAIDIIPGYLLFFGRLVEYKGTRTLSSVIKRCSLERPDIRFLVFGDGPERGLFESLATEYPHQVTFWGGFVNEKVKRKLIANSVAVLFPSIYPTEAFGIAQLEAMACAKPIINCWLPTGVNWVAPDGECAITVYPDDEQALLDAVIRIHDDKAFNERMGQQACLRFHTFFSEAAISSDFKRIVEDQS